MEASAPPKTFEQILQKIEEIVNDESNSKDLFDKIKECDVKAKAILKQQLGNVLTGLKNLDTESSSKKASMRFFSKGSSSQNRLNTQKKKAIEDLERIARKAEYLNGTREALVGKAEEGLKLVGREKEKKDIIDQLMLLSRSPDGGSRVPVIIIAGLAGIGKTKLASHVCQDREVRNHVGFPTWVICTNYNTFDADSIAKRVIDDTTNSTNRIVILDDWRLEIRDQHVKALQDKIKEARLCLKAIIITTRSCLVLGNIAASPVKLYALPVLNKEESLSLFQTVLGRDAGDRSSNPEIDQCRGVPLAIITMAKCRRSPSQLTELMDELIYSYYDEKLPHLCFAYCSLFPQDYLFDAERLIHLWMAEGFLNPSTSSGSGPEEIGRSYLMDLVGRSIFQVVTEDEIGQVRSCTMHPLMHDIARFLADRENINVDLNGDKVHQQVLLASFDLSLGFPRGIPGPFFDKAKQLRSILFFANTQSRLTLQLEMSTQVLGNIFKSFKYLSVLDLRELKIKAVPSSIGELKELKYLDLSQNDMEKLPSSIAKLTELETLKLFRCYSLKELPKELKNLAKLKHLDLEGCLSLSAMPREMSRLSALQTLSAFVANEKDPMGDLEELAKLNNLRGHLEILHLDRVQNTQQSNGTKYLEEKQHLRHLTLRWDQVKGKNHLSLLDRLKPHSNLKALILIDYKGPSLSSWLTSIPVTCTCLVKLRLQDCPGCESLSKQDQLPKLKILELVRLDKLEYVFAQNCDEEAAFYKNLEQLKIEDCPKLKSWWQTKREENDRPLFAKISKLHVRKCPSLTSMPLYPRLEDCSSYGKEMFLEGSSLQLLDTISVGADGQGFSIPLENLHIQNCNHLKNPCNVFKRLSSLQRLSIENCKDINLDGESNQWEGLKSLRFLRIRDISTLRSLSFGDSVTTLRELTLDKCQQLTSISDSIGKLTSLRRLEISKCSELKSLPKTMEKLKTLRILLILDCALLLPRCQPETGDDWPQISHIDHIQVK